jgi:hypothetical protein
VHLSEPVSKFCFFPDEPVDCGQSAATGHQMSQLLPGLLSCRSGSENTQNASSSCSQFIKELCQESRAVEWEEPEFTDNVGVTSVMASQLPGQRLGLGRQATHLPYCFLLS